MQSAISLAIQRAEQLNPNPISLQFASDVSETVRFRIAYAFRVFAAIYGHVVVQAGAVGSIRCFYGRTAGEAAAPDTFCIPALYEGTQPGNTANAAVRRRYAGEEFYLSLGFDEATKRPDWLGEIFLWLSSQYETGISARDSVGRIPFSEMIFTRAGISPRKPHATMLMAWLENELAQAREEALPRGLSPFPGVQHAVMSSHDIDFYFVDRLSALVRLTKNLGVAMQIYRSWSYFGENSWMILQLLSGQRVGDFLPSLVAASKTHNFRSTLFAVSRRGHRRDPAYRLEQISPRLMDAARQGFSLGVHGSYRSVSEDRTLPMETKELATQSRVKPLGSRQHWLRFRSHEDLFEQVSRAGLICESTLGFADTVGFRNGASFAFPPYDFANERAYKFLEIPLVLMDGGLETAARKLRASPQELAEEVLRESRKHGWGGVSLLWHNPVESLSVPAEINEVFWNCAKQQEQFGERWMGVNEFLAGCVSRYQEAGLLEGVRVNV